VSLTSAPQTYCTAIRKKGLTIEMQDGQTRVVKVEANVKAVVCENPPINKDDSKTHRLVTNQ
jgi:hypothetical protein